MRKRTFLPLVMLLLVVAGALLPMGIAALDTSRLENQVDARPLPDIRLELHPEEGVEGVLAIWAQDNMSLELSQGSKSSEQEAKEAAGTVIELLVERGLLPVSFSGIEVESLSPIAAISNDEPNSAAVIWSGNAPEAAPYLLIYVDDATGKLVGISYDMDEGETVDTLQWAEFLKEYYSLSALRTESLSTNQASVRCVWELAWNRDDQEITCPFTLMQRGNKVYINV